LHFIPKSHKIFSLWLSFEMHVMCLFEFWWGKEIEGKKNVKNIKIMLISLLSPNKQVYVKIYIFVDQNRREFHWALIFTNYLWLRMWNYCFIVPFIRKFFFHSCFFHEIVDYLSYLHHEMKELIACNMLTNTTYSTPWSISKWWI